ncbi:Protein sat1 [Lachnellula hyalina]|uniref:Protein sat1 n=1 Tax=Lachnellula hyalina TaxID=1316788 RepID=A0A8H8U4C8_9HELO|nr:Protein sat1 [Lachnellula hyalina]TVY31183.1 Protein sat1 [Lachnellula hyalina]
MSTPLTNIRVFVQWTEQTVFAGEDIECQVTFKNIAPTPTPSRAATLHPPSVNGPAPGGERQRKSPVSQVKNGSVLSSSSRPAQPSRGHRTTMSLNVPVNTVRSQGASDSWNGAPMKGREGSAHKRSVSIISISASENGVVGDVSGHAGKGERPRLNKSHGRSASLQIVPRRHGVNGGPVSAPLNQRSSTQPSPLLVSSFSPLGREHTLPEHPSRRQSGAATAPSTPAITRPASSRRHGSASLPQGFKFPSVTSPSVDSRAGDNYNGDEGTHNFQANAHLLSPRTKDSISIIPEQAGPTARVLSPASILGTPRSSGEFYSLSNNSTETLASEYLPQQNGRVPTYGGHTRRPSNLVPVNHHRPPETLMMGYAQIHGSFTIDGSLISQAPFEEVKRKGAVGGQGGGVIGLEKHKRDSGLLRGFGWGNIGESLGGLLGGGELSSIKDMRGIASSRSIPLLSTPQSILFVDLRLAPGESQSYKYAFKLPRGLPPSHRGKTIKISYRLVIGTQRPGGAKEQQVKSVEVPFRVLGSVNSHGELLGHDLMSPYIILRDQARVRVIQRSLGPGVETPRALKIKTASKVNESTLNDFLSYVDELLEGPRQNSGHGLLSPTDAPRTRRQSSVEEPATAKDAIDMAILRSNTATESQQSANRFEIARSGKRVAVVMLARPAYRLGETITAAVDFTDAEIPCYAVHMTLETSEKVDSSLALRSDASILRVTRKIYVSHSESTLFARRIFFSPAIPPSATPEFITSGVGLEWRIRMEFVTPRLALGDSELMPAKEDLLEEVSRDDRGVVLASAEVLDCESFEIAVPLRVYGAFGGHTERDEEPTHGLVV